MHGCLITCNLNRKLHDYQHKLRHKTFHFYVCYHILSAYLSFHAILGYNLEIHYFRDNYVFLRIYFRLRLFSSIFEIIIGF